MNSIVLIAINEFQRTIKQPLVIALACLLLLLAILNGAGSVHLLPRFDQLNDGNDHLLSVGISNTLMDTQRFMFALGTFIGVLSIIQERSRGQLRVLVTKPLYRRDIVAGKVLGLSTFLFIICTIDILLCLSSIMIFYTGPVSINELVIRIASYIFTLYLGCTLTLCITIMIGVLFKDYILALILSGTLFCFESFYIYPTAIGEIKNLIPVQLYFTIIDGNGYGYLFYTSIDYCLWLSYSLPYIILMVLLISAVLLATMYAFGRDDL